MSRRSRRAVTEGRMTARTIHTGHRSVGGKPFNGMRQSPTIIAGYHEKQNSEVQTSGTSGNPKTPHMPSRWTPRCSMRARTDLHARLTSTATATVRTTIEMMIASRSRPPRPSHARAPPYSELTARASATPSARKPIVLTARYRPIARRDVRSRRRQIVRNEDMVDLPQRVPTYSTSSIRSPPRSRRRTSVNVRKTLQAYVKRPQREIGPAAAQVSGMPAGN